MGLQLADQLRSEKLIQAGRAIDFNYDVMRGDPDLGLLPLPTVLSQSFGSTLVLFRLGFEQTDTLIKSFEGLVLVSSEGGTFSISLRLADTPVGKTINPRTIQDILSDSLDEVQEQVDLHISREGINRSAPDFGSLTHTISISFVLDLNEEPDNIYRSIEATLEALNNAIYRIRELSSNLFGGEKKIYDSKDVCVHPSFHSEP